MEFLDKELTEIGMKISPMKTRAMIVTPGVGRMVPEPENRPFQYSVYATGESVEIQWTAEAEYLGVPVREGANFGYLREQRVKAVETALKQLEGIVGRNKLSLARARQLVLTTVVPTLTYAIELLGLDKDRVDSILNKALLLIAGLPEESDISKEYLRHELAFPMAHELFLCRNASFVFRMLKSKRKSMKFMKEYAMAMLNNDFPDHHRTRWQVQARRLCREMKLKKKEDFFFKGLPKVQRGGPREKEQLREQQAFFNWAVKAGVSERKQNERRVSRVFDYSFAVKRNPMMLCAPNRALQGHTLKAAVRGMLLWRSGTSNSVSSAEKKSRSRLRRGAAHSQMDLFVAQYRGEIEWPAYTANLLNRFPELPVLGWKEELSRIQQLISEEGIPPRAPRTIEVPRAREGAKDQQWTEMMMAPKQAGTVRDFGLATRAEAAQAIPQWLLHIDNEMICEPVYNGLREAPHNAGAVHCSLCAEWRGAGPVHYLTECAGTKDIRAYKLGPALEAVATRWPEAIHVAALVKGPNAENQRRVHYRDRWCATRHVLNCWDVSVLKAFALIYARVAVADALRRGQQAPPWAIELSREATSRAWENPPPGPNRIESRERAFQKDGRRAALSNKKKAMTTCRRRSAYKVECDHWTSVCETEEKQLLDAWIYHLYANREPTLEERRVIRRRNMELRDRERLEREREWEENRMRFVLRNQKIC